MSKIRIEDRPQVKNCLTIVIQDTDTGEIVGKIIGAYPKDGAGTLNVTLFDYTEFSVGCQDGHAAGCGYDKLAKALEGLKFDGLTLEDHRLGWEAQLLQAGYKATTL